MLRRLMLLCFINCQIGAQDTVTLQFTDNVTQQYNLTETKTMLKKQCPALADLFDENGGDVPPDIAIPFNLPSKAFNILQRMPAQFGTKDDVQQANSAKKKLLQLAQAQLLETINFAHQYDGRALLALSVEAVLSTEGSSTLLNHFGKDILTRISTEIATHQAITPCLLKGYSTILSHSEDCLTSWSPNGEEILVCDSQALSIYKYEGDKVVTGISPYKREFNQLSGSNPYYTELEGTQTHCEEGRITACDWSPNGDRFILRANSKYFIYDIFALYNSDGKVVTNQRNIVGGWGQTGTSDTFFTCGENTIWNSTGEQFIVTKGRCDYSFFLYDLDGTLIASNNQLPKGQPIWNKPGNRILISSLKSNPSYPRCNTINDVDFIEGQCNTWLYTAEGTPVKDEEPLAEGFAQWNPNGNSFLVEQPNGPIQLYSAEGELIKTQQPLAKGFAQWNPNGTSFLVTPPSGPTQLYSAEGELIETQQPLAKGFAQWNPNGNSFLVTEQWSNPTQLYSAEGELIKQLSAGRAQWSPSGNSFLAQPQRWRGPTQLYSAQGDLISTVPYTLREMSPVRPWTDLDNLNNPSNTGNDITYTPRNIFSFDDNDNPSPKLLKSIIDANSTGGWFATTKDRELSIYDRNSQLVTTSKYTTYPKLRPCRNQPAVLLETDDGVILYEVNILKTLLGKNNRIAEIPKPPPSCTLLLQAWKEVRRHSPTCTLLLQAWKKINPS